MTKINKVAIIGAGLMGSGIAQIFAMQGTSVALYHPRPSSCNALNKVKENLQLMQSYGIYQVQEIEDALSHITLTDNLVDAITDAELVIEVIPEDLSLKQTLFTELDSLCPSTTILASGTSVISITEIARVTQHKERIVGMHFWNPPFLIPLVEVIKTQWTDELLFEKSVQLLQQVGKHAIKVNKDIPGFLINRLQHALWREAIYLIEQGVADAKTVDEGIRNSFGLRLPILAPLENADMVGTDLTLAIHTYLFPFLNNATTPSPLLEQLVAQNKLGFKKGEGFQTWTEEQMAHSRKQLIEYLLQTIYKR